MLKRRHQTDTFIFIFLHMPEKKWTYADKPPGDLTDSLARAINISSELAMILVQRGIATYEQARDFFRPSLSHIHDPFLMKDMDKAVDRIVQALNNNHRILIYGDYDVDGTTAVTMVYGFFSRIYSNIDYYIPDRYKEGYGISERSIVLAAEHNVDLIISLDCGIKAVDRIKEAASAGIDFIVCDHHNPDPENLPPALAVLDPKQADCTYPYKELSGCGVGFKLLQGFCLKTGRNTEELWEYLDLLAISIASDIVPITGENRIFTYWGLRVLNKACRPGIKGLIKVADISEGLDINKILFGLAPRINAAGRIEHAGAAVELLLAGDEQKVNAIARKIDEHNKVRRDLDSSITEEALEMIEAEYRSTVLYKPDWHKGVVGIVASRCIERFYRPTIILTESNNLASGSARSISGFDLYEAIEKCSDLLIQYGGHTHAAGLTLRVEDVELFRQRFEEVTRSMLGEEDMIPAIEIDSVILLNKIDWKFFNIVKQMGPFGPGNLNPVFMSGRVRDNGRGKLLKDKHLKLYLQQNEDGPVYEAIGFNMPDVYDRIKRGEVFDVCYSIEENTFNGRTTLQLNIKDIKFRD